MVYPYGFRVADENIVDIFKKAKKHKAVDLPKNISIGRIGRLINPIRNDINIFNDRRTRESVLRVKKRVDIEIKKFENRKGYYVKFIKLF